MIKTMTNTSQEFYKELGPFLGKRHIAKEVGVNLWDDEGKMWFVAYAKDNVIGFAAITGKGKNCKFDLIYVLPEYRKIGVGTALSEAILEKCVSAGIKKINGVFSDINARIQLKLGYKQTGTKNGYMRLEKVFGDVKSE